ncbi:MAG: outer membrane protein transport protein [Polyangiales bacterium]
MTRRTRTALAFALALAPSLARANPLDMYGLGARSASLAGAVSADVHDTSATYYNPAGLARLRGLRVELGYFHAQPYLSMNGRDSGVPASHGLVAGIASPGRIFGLPFAVGIGLHLPDDRLSQVQAIPQWQPRWELYGVRLQRLYIAAMLAVSPVRWLRLGGGVAFMAATRGSVDISGVISVTNQAETSLAHTVDVDLSAVRYAQFGAQVDLGRGVTAAFSWRQRFALDLSIDLALQGRIVAGPVDNPGSIVVPGTYRLSSHTVAAYQPEQWVLGGAWVINPRWRVMLDLTWARWSSYENPTSSLQTSLELRLPPELAGALRVPSIPPSAPREPARFHDTLITRVGAEFTAPIGRHSVAVRAGYAWDPSPVPEQPGVTNFVDSDRHIFTLGGGLALRRLGAVFPGTLSLDVYAAAQVLPSRAFAKASPVDLVGDFTAGGAVLSAGATLGAEFD